MTKYTQIKNNKIKHEEYFVSESFLTLLVHWKICKPENSSTYEWKFFHDFLNLNYFL